jgi:hypothetical protein
MEMMRGNLVMLTSGNLCCQMSCVEMDKQGHLIEVYHTIEFDIDGKPLKFDNLPVSEDEVDSELWSKITLIGTAAAAYAAAVDEVCKDSESVSKVMAGATPELAAARAIREQ